MAYGFYDINVQYIHLPRGSHGACKFNDHDDSVTIMLDPRDSWEMQRSGYLHELGHLINGDFDNIQDKDVSQLEHRAHLMAYAAKLKRAQS